MLSFDPASAEDVIEAEMSAAIESVHTAQITYAARDSDFDGHNIRKGEYLALMDGALLGSDADLDKVLTKIADAANDLDPEIVSIYYGEDVQGDCCCFAVDTGNEDVASAMFLCESGAIISYNQNFTVKRTAARRGCRIIGTKGSAEFDFYTGVIRHDDYAFDQTATIQIRPTGGNHFGGDRRLAQDFMNLLAGGKPSSDLSGGLRSAACCLAAKRSAETGCLTEILL